MICCYTVICPYKWYIIAIKIEIRAEKGSQDPCPVGIRSRSLLSFF